MISDAEAQRLAIQPEIRPQSDRNGRPRVGVGVFVVRDTEPAGLAARQILVGRRRGAEGHGTYGLPGGWLEAGESFENCAAREVLEETGMVADQSAMKVIRVTNNIFARSHSVTLFILATATGQPETLEPEKCAGWQWMTLSELRNMKDIFLPLRTVLDENLDDPDLDASAVRRL